jgi:acylphosphatase
MSQRHLNIRIFGHVQEVFFRHTASKVAETLHVKGFVRNEPDGNVYMEVEGEDEALDSFLEWCRVGPKHAKVEDLEVSEDSIQNFEDFWIEE